jgi:TonB family protein
MRQFAAVACYISAMSLAGCVATTPQPQGLVTTPVTVDQAHPPRIGESFYPMESRRLHEEGSCSVHIRVELDGSVSDAHIVLSSGSERLDSACIAGLTSEKFIPATVNGKPVAEWAVQRINWKLTNYPPTINRNSLHVGPKYYPAESWARRLEGDCVVHVFVELDAHPNNASIVQSTGSPILDQACVKAVMEAHYWAGTANGAPYGAWMDVPMSWRLAPQ